MGHYWPFSFHHLNTVDKIWVKHIFPMTGFKLRTSGVRSDRSTNEATPLPFAILFLHKSVQNINLVKGPIHLRPTATTAATATKPNSSRMQEWFYFFETSIVANGNSCLVSTADSIGHLCLPLPFSATNRQIEFCSKSRQLSVWPDVEIKSRPDFPKLA